MARLVFKQWLPQLGVTEEKPHIDSIEVKGGYSEAEGFVTQLVAVHESELDKSIFMGGGYEFIFISDEGVETPVKPDLDLLDAIQRGQRP